MKRHAKIEFTYRNHLDSNNPKHRHILSTIPNKTDRIIFHNAASLRKYSTANVALYLFQTARFRAKFRCVSIEVDFKFVTFTQFVEIEL